MQASHDVCDIGLRKVEDMAVKGSVFGDILGAQYEFDRPKDLDWKNIPLTVGDAMQRSYLENI